VVFIACRFFLSSWRFGTQATDKKLKRRIRGPTPTVGARQTDGRQPGGFSFLIMCSIQYGREQSAVSACDSTFFVFLCVNCASCTIFGELGSSVFVRAAGSSSGVAFIEVGIFFWLFFGGKHVCVRGFWGCLSLHETFSDDGNAICIDGSCVTVAWKPGKPLN